MFGVKRLEAEGELLAVEVLVGVLGS